MSALLFFVIFRVLKFPTTFILQINRTHLIIFSLRTDCSRLVKNYKNAPTKITSYFEQSSSFYLFLSLIYFTFNNINKNLHNIKISISLCCVA